ncbi:MAG TPA: flagellar basal body-associated FliL family protein [Acetobacteraceae bacterium]|jgi:flagellar FliL protein|nr:flagellar basal body-associated FliL family protein [Acetobacteraceae bacterium]
MSATVAVSDEKVGKKGKLKLILLAVAVLAALGAGGWFSGLIPKLLHKEPAHAAAAAEPAPVPVFLDMPEIVANLNTGGRRAAFIKLRAKLELSRKQDEAAIQAAMPRVLDLFQSYLREMRPEELRGTAGTYRLREELVARTNLAAAPARVVDVLFIELLVQ